ncbi:unnamed protein product [Penicillium olsonii]|nr:unnamed protein product [Penicillium olsonii]
MPKPVEIVHSALSADTQRLISKIDKSGIECQREIMAQSREVYTAFPLFHIAGLSLFCFLLLSRCTLVLGFPGQPPSLFILRKVLEFSQIDGLLLPPSLIGELSMESDLVEDLSRIRWIGTGGGMIPESSGNTVVSKTRLLNGLGSTECGAFIQHPTDPTYWKYFHFHDLNGIFWKPLSDQNSEHEEYEMIIQRNDSILPHQAVFQNFPNLQEWATKDVFRKHPSVANLWEYAYRRDDIIVFSSGEKMNPIPIENQLCSISGINAALVFGSNRASPGILLEIADASPHEEMDLPLQASAQQEFQNVLAKVNSENSRDARLEDHIVAAPEKPFVRTPKGTIHRAKTLQLYKNEIEDFYGSNESSISSSLHEINLDLGSRQALQSSLATLINAIVSKSHAIGADDNIFEAGLDSKQTQILAAIVKRKLDAGSTFSVDTVYQGLTPRKISDHIWQSMSSPQSSNDSTDFEALLEEYIQRLPSEPCKRGPHLPPKKKRHILVTGSSGFIGSYVLSSLIGKPDVDQITCLNRSGENTTTTHTQKCPTNAAEPPVVKVKHMVADLSWNNMGLSQSVYDHLLETVTDVLHCQWPVDFNQPLGYFKPSFEGVVNLVWFAHAAQLKPRLIFLSSVATVKNWGHDSPVPEISLQSKDLTQTGYGESKLLASLLLEHAARQAKIHSTICRLGQIAGPTQQRRDETNGTWPLRDWFPTLLLSSSQLGYLPESLGSADMIDWIPVDSAAEFLGDLVCNRGSTKDTHDPHSVDYYHLVNPSTTDYTEMTPFLAERLGNTREKLEVVSLQSWIGHLMKESLTDLSSQNANPAMKLLSFYQALAASQSNQSVTLETKMTVDRFPWLQGIGPVTQEWLGDWLRQWGW